MADLHSKWDCQLLKRESRRLRSGPYLSHCARSCSVGERGRGSSSRPANLTPTQYRHIIEKANEALDH
jgi:hypothetical protein